MPMQLDPPDLIGWRFGRTMSQKQLARHLGVTRETINRWETGRSPIPGDLEDRLFALKIPRRTTHHNSPHLYTRVVRKNDAGKKYVTYDPKRG